MNPATDRTIKALYAVFGCEPLFIVDRSFSASRRFRSRFVLLVCDVLACFDDFL